MKKNKTKHINHLQLRFVNITNTTRKVATKYLNLCDNDLDDALTIYEFHKMNLL